MRLPFAKIMKQVNDSAHSATFAICLRGMRVIPAEEQQRYENFIFDLLGRQMDFIHSLHALPENYCIDLRYLFDPANPHHLRIYFLIRVLAGKKAEASAQAERLALYILNSLLIHNHLYEFGAIEDENELRYLEQPFAFEHIVEIIRREEIISLDAVRRKSTKHLGFCTDHTERSIEALGQRESQIYYVFPYSLNLDNMERLCNALFLQQHPCMISICMKPYPITPKDEARLEEQVNLCEKYSQLSLQTTEPVERLAPFLRSQASTLYKNCVTELLQIQDAAFLLKVQITSSHPISHELATVTGVTITEHTGHPKPIFDEALACAFTGGYEWYNPEDEDEFSVAHSNLSNMDFRPWIPSLSEPAFRHWRYLFDVSEASTAFRLPIPTAAEFPGIDTIQYHPKPAPSDLPLQRDPPWRTFALKPEEEGSLHCRGSPASCVCCRENRYGQVNSLFAYDYARYSGWPWRRDNRSTWRVD